MHSYSQAHNQPSLAMNQNPKSVRKLYLDASEGHDQLLIKN